METQKNYRNRLIDCILSSALTALVLLGTGKVTMDNTRKECAYRAAMTHYQPVGNGGALAEMQGRISPERTKMYEKMKDVYREVKNSYNPQ